MAMETGIGQGKTLVSPLHMALIASAVDHDGILMRPYLVNHIQNDSGVEVSSNKPKTYATLMTETEAGLLQQYMLSLIHISLRTKGRFNLIIFFLQLRGNHAFFHTKSSFSKLQQRHMFQCCLQHCFHIHFFCDLHRGYSL